MLLNLIYFSNIINVLMDIADCWKLGAIDPGKIEFAQGCITSLNWNAKFHFACT